MKVRDSGMPTEEWWNSFFDVPVILDKLQINSSVVDLVEIGSGYGTFTIPAARLISGTLYSYDIEAELLKNLKSTIAKENLTNARIIHRDILAQTTGLENNSVDYVMLFNILHHDRPEEFLTEALRILKPGGKVGIIHWRSDVETPRGPDLSIRPKPEDILRFVNPTQFTVGVKPLILQPYHYGLTLVKS